MSDADFAVRVGVPTTSLSVWLNDRRPPSAENADKLAAILGMEVYDKLGIPRRMPTEKRFMSLVRLWEKLGEVDSKLQDRWIEEGKTILEEKDTKSTA